MGADILCSSNIAECAGEGTDFSVFVGDLSPEVTDFMLQEIFRQFFPSVRSAKVRPSEKKQHRLPILRPAPVEEKIKHLFAFSQV